MNANNAYKLQRFESGQWDYRDHIFSVLEEYGDIKPQREFITTIRGDKRKDFCLTTSETAIKLTKALHEKTLFSFFFYPSNWFWAGKPTDPSRKKDIFYNSKEIDEKSFFLDIFHEVAHREKKEFWENLSPREELLLEKEIRLQAIKLAGILKNEHNICFLAWFKGPQDVYDHIKYYLRTYGYEDDRECMTTEIEIKIQNEPIEDITIKEKPIDISKIFERPDNIRTFKYMHNWERDTNEFIGLISQMEGSMSLSDTEMIFIDKYLDEYGAKWLLKEINKDRLKKFLERLVYKKLFNQEKLKELMTVQEEQAIIMPIDPMTVYRETRKKILAIDKRLEEKYRKDHIGYSIEWKHILTTKVLKSKVVFELSGIQPEDMDDPEGKLMYMKNSMTFYGKDISKIEITTSDDIDYVMSLIDKFIKKLCGRPGRSIE